MYTASKSDILKSHYTEFMQKLHNLVQYTLQPILCY